MASTTSNQDATPQTPQTPSAAPTTAPAAKPASQPSGTPKSADPANGVAGRSHAAGQAASAPPPPGSPPLAGQGATGQQAKTAPGATAPSQAEAQKHRAKAVRELNTRIGSLQVRAGDAGRDAAAWQTWYATFQTLTADTKKLADPDCQQQLDLAKGNAASALRSAVSKLLGDQTVTATTSANSPQLATVRSLEARLTQLGTSLEADQRTKMNSVLQDTQRWVAVVVPILADQSFATASTSDPETAVRCQAEIVTLKGFEADYGHKSPVDGLSALRTARDARSATIRNVQRVLHDAQKMTSGAMTSLAGGLSTVEKATQERDKIESGLQTMVPFLDNTGFVAIPFHALSKAQESRALALVNLPKLKTSIERFQAVETSATSALQATDPSNTTMFADQAVPLISSTIKQIAAARATLDPKVDWASMSDWDKQLTERLTHWKEQQESSDEHRLGKKGVVGLVKSAVMGSASKRDNNLPSDLAMKQVQALDTRTAQAEKRDAALPDNEFAEVSTPNVAAEEVRVQEQLTDGTLNLQDTRDARDLLGKEGDPQQVTESQRVGHMEAASAMTAEAEEVIAVAPIAAVQEILQRGRALFSAPDDPAHGNWKDLLQAAVAKSQALGAQMSTFLSKARPVMTTCPDVDAHATMHTAYSKALAHYDRLQELERQAAEELKRTPVATRSGHSVSLGQQRMNEGRATKADMKLKSGMPDVTDGIDSDDASAKLGVAITTDKRSSHTKDSGVGSSTTNRAGASATFFQANIEDVDLTPSAKVTVGLGQQQTGRAGYQDAGEDGKMPNPHRMVDGAEKSLDVGVKVKLGFETVLPVVKPKIKQQPNASAHYNLGGQSDYNHAMTVADAGAHLMPDPQEPAN